MKIEIPIELVKETVKALTDQINMEMETNDPCPGVSVPADKKYPWYVELRNLFQEQLDKRDADYNLGFKFAQYLFQRAIDNEIDYEDIVCPACVSDAFQDGFSDCIASIEVKPQTITEQTLGSRESCEDKDAWDDFNKAIEEV